MTTTYGVDSSLVDSLFTSPSSTVSAQMDTFAQRNLVQGVQLYSDGKYDEAIRVLKRAVGYSPQSSTAVSAYDYIAKAYITQGDNASAIKTYQQSITADSSQDATYTSLANLYYSQENYTDALANYQKAAKLNPSGATLYSLGQGYMATGQYNDAMDTFNQVRRLAPDEPYGQFGMGQVYAKQGLYDAAVSEFKKAINLDPQYWNAYSEMGYALADSGDLQQAQSIVTNILENNDSNLASQLSLYIDSKTKPKIESSSYTNGIATPFLTLLGPGTKVSNLGNLSLLEPDATQTFTISFQFSKTMDQSSVENVSNWTITRANGNYLSDTYNYGQSVPSTEALLPYNPSGVVYDSNTQTATLFFKVAQNSSATATIDPSHIKFTFNGTDANGLVMDSSANEYTGFSGIA